MQAPLYFIAIVPNEEVSAEITTFKNDAATNFEAKRALRSPPHITVIPPFRAYYNEIENISNALAAFSEKQTPFDIDLLNFNHFGQAVIYVDVVKNEQLQALRQALSSLMEKEFQIVNKFQHHPFVPHITIAFKDLTPRMYPEAWEFFSNIHYENTFKTQDLVLLINEDKQWQIVQKFPFQPKN